MYAYTVHRTIHIDYARSRRNISKFSCIWLWSCGRVCVCIESCELNINRGINSLERAATAQRRHAQNTNEEIYWFTLAPKTNKFQLKQNNYVDDVAIEPSHTRHKYTHPVCWCELSRALSFNGCCALHQHTANEQSLFALAQINANSNITNWKHNRQ